MIKPPLLVRGMHGQGDNLHQRAIMAQLMECHTVYLESSWVSIYHDLIPRGLKVIPKPTKLRTQNKNAMREQACFSDERPPANAKTTEVWYRPGEVRRCGSVLAAMCAATGCDMTVADFRLPIPPEWAAGARDLLATWKPHKPLLIYRPLNERAEWSGCVARNPDHEAYAALFDSIRERFFVVSLADLEPGKEWMVGLACEADVYLHKGELNFETMAALFAQAALVFCSPGFAVILAQAVGTPVTCIFGGYERAYSFSGGARFSPYLGIEPINPTDSFSHDTRHDKTIDVAQAAAALELFAAAAAERGGPSAAVQSHRPAHALSPSG